MASEDWFDSVLNLEDDCYNEGYKLGVDDGSRAGRIEGRIFGLEKGFEKYLAMGQLHGKACVWAARMSHTSLDESPGPQADESSMPNFENRRKSSPDITKLKHEKGLLPLPANARLEKHVGTLYALTEPESLSTQNNENAVSDFDDRYKRSVSKVKVIQNIIGERSLDLEKNEGESDEKKLGNVDNRITITRGDTIEKSIEDFGARKVAS